LDTLSASVKGMCPKPNVGSLVLSLHTIYDTSRKYPI